MADLSLPPTPREIAVYKVASQMVGRVVAELSGTLEARAVDGAIQETRRSIAELTTLLNTILKASFGPYDANDLLDQGDIGREEAALEAATNGELTEARLDLKMAIHDLRNPLMALEYFFGENPPDLLKSQVALSQMETVLARGAALPLYRVLGLAPALVSFPETVKVLYPGELREAQLTLSSTRLLIILNNLLENAKKAGATTVTINVEKMGNELVFLVSDTGKGFEGVDPFRAGMERQAMGHGIALETCRIYAEQAGGSLDAGDLNKRGADFKLVVPIKMERSML